MVASWIVHAIIPKLACNVIYVETLRDLRLDLEERFSQANDLQIFELQQKIISISQGYDSITIYYSVTARLPPCTCDSSKTLGGYRDRDRTMQLFMGLNKSYTTVRGQILLMNPIQTMSKVFSLLLQDEPQRGMVVPCPTMESVAPTAKKSDNGGKNCHQNYSNNSKIIYDFCGRIRQVKEKCNKLHGYPPSHKLYKGPNQFTPSQASANQISNTKFPFHSRTMPTGFNIN